MSNIPMSINLQAEHSISDVNIVQTNDLETTDSQSDYNSMSTENEHETSSGSDEPSAPVPRNFRPVHTSPVQSFHQRVNATTETEGEASLDPHHRQQHQHNRRQHALQEQANVVQPQPPEEPVLPGNNEHQQRLTVKKIFDHETLPLAKGSVALMICAWMMLYLPSKAMLENSPMQLVYLVYWTCCVALIFLAIRYVIRKKNIRMHDTTSTLAVRTLQLSVIGILCLSFEILMDLVVQMGVLPFNGEAATRFRSNLNSISNPQELYDNTRLSFLVNVQFFVVSFAILLLLGVPTSFFKIQRHDRSFREILEFEIYAHFYPTAWLLLPFFLMNGVALTVPVKLQTFPIWGIMHLAAICWCCFIMYGVWYYPEIPIARPLGLPGYIYIELVSCLELTLGMVFFNFINLIRTTYFHLVPGAFKDAIASPGFLVGSIIYFQQLEQGRPQETWKHDVPYPATFEFLQGAFFLVFIARHWKLMTFMDVISERLEHAALELEGH